ncbi:MAG: ArsA family ATPase [Myxococcales bacterium]|nr:ArsA family ATPase [Myxococcales bacterium]
MRAPEGSTFLAPLVATKKVLVCCGAGGVGKTTTSAALGFAAGLAGRRALVLTIDPARRLAEAMGIPAGSREPVRVPRERLVAAAETYRPGGTVGDVDAWMLAPAVVFEELVRRVAPDPERARVVLSSRLYRHLSEVVAGMQEYTAAEALYSLSSSGKYDLIVLDTPPSRNALAFLEAPRKLSMFLDERVLGLFLPGAEKRGFVYGGAAAVVRNVFTRVLGESFWAELQEFLERFSSMFDPMRQHAGSVRELLRSDQTAFVLVSSPEPGALREAAFFEEKLRELELPFEGTVLNRSWAYTRGLEHPSALGDSDVELRVVEKMRPLAVQELARAERDRKLLGLLRDRQRGKPAVATPHLTTELDDLAGLVSLAAHLIGEGRDLA